MVPQEPQGSGTIIRPWTIDAVTGDANTFGHRQDASGTMHVGHIGVGGVSELSAIPDAGPYRFALAPAAVEGGQCAVLVSDLSGAFLSCPGMAVEAAGIRDVGADHLPVPFVHADGSLSVFTQTYASFTELRRTAPGTWHEIEQYESSISYPTDAVDVGGEPVVCFISQGDRAVLARGDAELASVAETSSCKLAIDGSSIHVLTDAGYAKVSIASIVGNSGTFDVTPVAALADQRVVRIVVVDGVAYALGTGAGVVNATPLAGGEPVVFGMVTNTLGAIGWDAATAAVRVVTSKLDTSGEGPMFPQTITFQTECFE